MGAFRRRSLLPTGIRIFSFRSLRRMFLPTYKVYFSGYKQKIGNWVVRVGCCESHMSDVMDNKMKIKEFEATDFIEGQLRHGDVSNIEICGSYYIIGNECKPELIFQSSQKNYTDQLEIQHCDSSSSTSNTAVLNIYMAGAQIPRSINFKVEDDDTQSPHSKSRKEQRDDIRESAPMEALPQQVVGIIPGDNSSCISSPTPEKVWLSDLQKDYNFVQCLEKAFEGTSIGNVKDFIFTFDLSYEDRCKILTCARASMAFMKNLSKTKPQMSLSNLRGIIEEKCGRMQPNMAIFKKVDDDIASGAVSFTLDSTLGDLSDVPQSWLYILETIGGNLVPETGTLLKSWKNIASACGYETSEIADFETSNAGSKGSESPMQKFLSIICTREPSFLISAFVEKLRTFGRNDIVQLVEQWQGKKAGVSGN